MTLFDMNIGDKLPNGATLLRFTIASSGQAIVLATWKTGPRAEWITWRCNANDAASTYSGNYFTPSWYANYRKVVILLEAAIADYNKRVAKLDGISILSKA